MTSAINEIDMEFEEIKISNIETIGSVSQITRPCPIKYKSRCTGKQYLIFIGFVILVYIYLWMRWPIITK
jgi:hypothetical protein